MKLSILISAYDHHDITVAHVKGCFNSTRIPDEIIVVNDGGTEDLKEMLKGIEKKDCSLIYARILQDIPWNQQGARNLGLFISTGDCIATEDHDHIPHPDFYRQAMEKIEEGYTRIYGWKRYVITKEDALANPSDKFVAIKSRSYAKMISVCTRELLLKVKGFDEQYAGRYGWDVPAWKEQTERCGAKTISVGIYYVVDVLSKEKDREFLKGATKLHPQNFHIRQRTKRNQLKQSPIGILNFNFELERIL